jgi:ubiquinone/menaquinone biosynthesis C-methylase UbiE
MAHRHMYLLKRLTYHPGSIVGVHSEQARNKSMAKTSCWNWNRVTSEYWSEPAEDVYHLLHKWKQTKRHRVLDLGSGLGRHSILFASHGFDVTAMDSSASGLRALADTAQEETLAVTMVQGDLIDLPFEEACFDAVLAYHSIYHVDSGGMRSAIAELRRVLAPDGEAYLTLNSKTNATYSNPDNPPVDENVRMKVEEDGSILPHFYCDLDDIRQLLDEFRIVSLRQVEDIYEDGTSWHYFALVGRT